MDRRKPIDAYKAVFFDVGDTLMTIPAARALLRQLLAGKSFHREERQIGDLFNEAFRLFYYEKRLNPGETCSPESDRAFWISLYHYILERLGAKDHWTDDEIHACCHEIYTMFTGPEVYRLFDDVQVTLEALRARGLRLAVVSNFAPTLRDVLRAKGVLHYFNPLIVSTEVGIEKPNPDIFRLALREADLEPADVLYVGDHEQNDIWAPAQVGIDAVRIMRYDHLTGEGIRSLAELFDSESLPGGGKSEHENGNHR